MPRRLSAGGADRDSDFRGHGEGAGLSHKAAHRPGLADYLLQGMGRNGRRNVGRGTKSVGSLLDDGIKGRLLRLAQLLAHQKLIEGAAVLRGSLRVLRGAVAGLAALAVEVAASNDVHALAGVAAAKLDVLAGFLNAAKLDVQRLNIGLRVAVDLRVNGLGALLQLLNGLVTIEIKGFCHIGKFHGYSFLSALSAL